jgi:hypothetical protein
LTHRFDNVVVAEVQATDAIRQFYPEALGLFATAMISHLRRKNVFVEVDQDTGKVLTRKTIRVEPSIHDMRITGGFLPQSHQHPANGCALGASQRLPDCSW